MKLTFKETLKQIKEDQLAYYRKATFGTLCKTLGSGVGSRLLFWARLNAYFGDHRILFFPLYVLCRSRHRKYGFKFGIDIYSTKKIGGGLLIGHFSGIVLSKFATIGKNCAVFQGVTVGSGGRSGDGYPTIGDNVYIGAGAKVLGNIKGADGAAIGANAVVVRDVPAGYSAIGIPARNIPPKNMTPAG